MPGGPSSVFQAVKLPPPLHARTVLAMASLVLPAWGAPVAQGEGDDTQTNDAGAIPEPVQFKAFEPLLASSPFTRHLGASDSLILTGVARLNDEVVATIFDTKTQTSQVVSRAPNSDGWRLVSVDGDPARLQTWAAKIQIQGGEVVSIRYQKPPPKLAGRGPSGTSGSSAGSSSGGSLPPITSAQADEARKAAVNYREGFSGDGYPRQPPPEVVEKLSRLSTSQREEINRQMMGHRNRGLGLDERRRIYDDLLNRAAQGRR